MIRLLTDLTDRELTRRIHKLEEVQETLIRDLSKLITPYKRDLLFKKREICLNLYAEAIYEAAYRDLIKIH